MHIAEESGLIVPIGRWVMREACKQAVCWGLHQNLSVPISVNVCEIEFSQADFASHLQSMLDATGLAPESLCIDLTERVIMRTPESTMARLLAFKKMGVQIAIDDFGTGYSSLSYLSQLPIDTLKIVRSFVQDIAGSSIDPKDGMIASAEIAMGASLRQTVVAEGIETQAQLDFLKNLDYEEGQGFYFSQPIMADSMKMLLQKKSRPVDGFARQLQTR